MPSDYTAEEAEAILTRAAGRKAVDSVSHRRLVEMAEELGISPEEVAAAAEEVLHEQEEQAYRKEFIAERRATVLQHLIPYVCVNLFLVTINVLTYHGKIWAVLPAMGWGIGLAIHMATALPTSGTTFEQEFAAWRKRREARTVRKAKRASKKAEAAAVAEGVGAPSPLPHTVKVEQSEPQTLHQRSGR